MQPIFTMHWTEFHAAEKLAGTFKKADGYSVFIPVSTQEKAVDLALIKKTSIGRHKTVTFQVKSGRTYQPPEPKRKTAEYFKFKTWVNTFDVHDEADYYILSTHYVVVPKNGSQLARTSEWYRDCTLVFDNSEMRFFIANTKTKGGKPDKMFGFGFNDDSRIVLTRGDESRSGKDYSEFLFENRVEKLRQEFL